MEFGSITVTSTATGKISKEQIDSELTLMDLDFPSKLKGQNMLRINLILTASLILLSFLVCQSKISMGQDKDFSESEIQTYFSQAALVDTPLNKDSRKDWPNLKILDPFRGDKRDSKAVISKKYPWLAEQLYPTNGIPKPFTPLKWNAPVKISFGMPNDMHPFMQNEEDLFKLFPDENNGENALSQKADFNLLKESIIDLANEISEETSLNVSYLSSKEENLKNYGNIRIIFVGKKHYTGKNFRERIGYVENGVGQFMPPDFRQHVEA